MYDIQTKQVDRFSQNSQVMTIDNQLTTISEKSDINWNEIKTIVNTWINSKHNKGDIVTGEVKWPHKSMTIRVNTDSLQRSEVMMNLF